MTFISPWHVQGLSYMLFDTLIALEQTLGSLKHLEGTYPGLQIGVCLDREDPMTLGRIRATVSNQGAKSETDWLLRIEPCPSLSLPVPKEGDTVAVLYKDGDPHQGFYLGVLQNALNPAFDKDSAILTVGTYQVVVEPSRLSLTGPGGSLVLSDDRLVGSIGSTVVSLTDGSFTVNGKEVCTLTALDNNGDRLISKGW